MSETIMPPPYVVWLMQDGADHLIGDANTLAQACQIASRYDGSILIWSEWGQMAKAEGKRGTYEVYRPDGGGSDG